MRILRLALRNFRGVVGREVQIAADGVTVIEGPNEAGKSTLAEAIDLLFDYADSSGDQRVRSAKRIGADVGAEVEAEITVGAYHLIYRKRWHRQPETSLRVLAPAPEQVSGRSAHARVIEILEENIDRALWRALRYQQGVGIDQPKVGDARSLLAALDAAAANSGLGLGGEAEDLWSRVGEEYRRYFTATGKATAERSELAGRVEARREEAESLDRVLAELEEAVDRYRSLELQQARNARSLAEQGEVVRQRSTEWERLQTEESRVGLLALEVERAAARVEKAAAAQRDRDRLIEERQAAEREAAGLAAQAEREAPGLEAATAAAGRAQESRDEARRARQLAEQAESLARGDLEYFRDLFSLETMRERGTRARQAEQSRSEAEAFLDGCRIGAEKLAEIERAFVEVVAARAGLQAESAAVRVEALAVTDLEVGGRGLSLAPGEVLEEAVAGSLQVLLPGRVRLTVTGGAGTREAEQELARAEERLQALYSAAGVSGGDPLAAARELERRRQAAEQARNLAEQALQDNLRDLTPQLLSEKIERAEERTRRHLAERAAQPPMPGSLSEADAALRLATAQGQQAKDELEQWEQALEVALEARRTAEATARERDFRLQAARDRWRASETALAQARESVGDEQLTAECTAAGEAAETASAAHQVAAAQLAAQNPEQARALAENAGAVLARFHEERREVEVELARVKSLLDVRGEAGLHDQRDAARNECERLQQEKAHIDRRAAAADLLRRTLGEHRDAAKRAYVAPFREQLERFGKVVFGADLAVEVNPDLQVVSRTLNGTTVPYELLSIGAKEQLSLLSRLACAVLVGRPGAADGGVPVIIDDALGNSDPERLERLGAVLNLAGRQVQVIVLTCTPDRYRNVGGATVIRLPAPGVGGDEKPALDPGTGEQGPVEPAAAGGEGEGSWASIILACLQAAGKPLGRSEIISRTGLPERLWQPAISSLLAQGQVEREGAKRGARYRPAAR